MKSLYQQKGIKCLNHGWKFIEKDFSILPPTKDHEDVYGFAKACAMKGPADAGFDDSAWENVELPHDWVTKKAFDETGSPNQGYKQRGIGWYRIRFALPKEAEQKQILLEFEGMSADAQIYVNGMIFKHNYSGYNSFCIDITDVANFGLVPNVLAVRIDASAWEGWWYEGAGIYRNVWLIEKSKVHISYQGVYLKPELIDNNKWKLNIQTDIENSFEDEQSFKLEHTFYDLDDNIIATVCNDSKVKGYSENTLNAEISVDNPALWSPDTPNLYKVKTSLYINNKEEDYQINKTGFRTIKIDANTGFWLNGVNLKLKGFCNHQDHAGVGVAVNYKINEYRIKKLKLLGANAYRCSHNPNPEILEICDKLGLMVMEENRTFSSAKDNIEEVKGIIKNARNHPCVILYSVCNEEPLQGTSKGRRMAGRLQAVIKQLDNTRPVLGALNGGYMEDKGASTILDVTGINYNPKRYDDFHNKYPNIPLIGSETASAFMVRGEYETNYDKHIIDDYDSESAPWGNTVKDAWRYINERPFVAGTFVWTGFDYRGEPTPFTWPSVATFFGTYDSCGFEKDACYLYKAFWQKEAIVHLVSPWNTVFKDKTPIKVLVYTNCEEVEVFVNGVSAGRKTADLYEQAAFTIPYEQGELKAVGYKDGKIVCEDKQLTALKADHLSLESVYNELESGGYSETAVNVTLLDKNGTVIPNADDLIKFEIKNGVIKGVGNGNPNSHEPDVASYRKLFHGKAQLILKPTSNETVYLRAYTDSGYESNIQIPIKEVESIPYIETVEGRAVDNWKLYYKLFDEMPNPKLKTDSNDMNSFEPVAFCGHPQAELSGKLGKYAMYRTKFEAGTACKGRSLYFPDIKGRVYIYIDGEEIASRTSDYDSSMVVNIDDNLESTHQLTVIIKNDNPHYPEAGICSPVILIQH